MTLTRDEIGTRVDALAHAHDGEEFIAAIERLANELPPEERPLLQEVLLDRAADEEDYKQAVRRRFAERGWTRRTLARVENLWRDDRADAIVDAIAAGPEGEEALAHEVEALRRDRGRAALVLDELSRHGSASVRAWVSPTAAAVLEDGGNRLILSLTRDRVPEVRDAAVAALVELGGGSARLILPDLRKRLHSKDAAERIAAMRALADAGDGSALPVMEERAASAELPEERRAAEDAAVALREGGA